MEFVVFYDEGVTRGDRSYFGVFTNMVFGICSCARPCSNCDERPYISAPASDLAPEFRTGPQHPRLCIGTRKPCKTLQNHTASVLVLESL